MSSAYRQFLDELRAEGPTKKDGFDLVNVRKLAGDERSGARDLLQRAVTAGDSTAVAALVELDTAEGLSFLRTQLTAAAATANAELVHARIVDTLLRAGRDEQADAALPALLRSKHAVVRQQAIAAAQHVWSDDQRRDLLVQSLRIEPDAMNRMAAASGLLHALGRQRDDGRAPDFRTALQVFASGNGDDRDRLLAALGVRV